MNSKCEVVAVGLAAGIPGSLIGLYVSKQAIGSGYEWLPLYAAVSAISAGIFFEQLLMKWKKSYTLKLGAIAGGLSGIVSHYICWYLIIFSHNICYAVWHGCTDSLGSPPVGPLQGLVASAVLSTASFMLFGWLTVLIGVILGGLLAVWFKHLLTVK